MFLQPWPKSWRPGCAHKKLVRRYRIVREGVDNIAKKKRALMKRKKLEMKPTLVVTKHDGDYTVQMEVYKNFSKERLINQYPYDENRIPIIYTIGKTEDTINKLQKQRERRERRETRRKSRLLQSTFRDKCQEICVKAYNQAIGLLPLPNPNMPDCPCDVAAIKAPSPVIDSCSCSETDGTISSSDSDGDDWVIEFTPPVARWKPKAKPPPITNDMETHYTYLDYKVKLLDKQGNPVPRFFKGPDGKEECSDLGGFWHADQWWEINKDGFIGPDGRWVPLSFTGPDGTLYSSEDGFFTDANGRKYVIGIDGYIDQDNKWCWYSRAPASNTVATVDKKIGKGKEEKPKDKKSPETEKTVGTQVESRDKSGGQSNQRPKLPARPNFDFLVDGKYDYRGVHPASRGPSALHTKCRGLNGSETKTNKSQRPYQTQQATPQPAQHTLTRVSSKKDMKAKKLVSGGHKSSKVVMNYAVNFDKRLKVPGRNEKWKGSSLRPGPYEFMQEMQMGYDDRGLRSPTKMTRASNTAAATGGSLGPRGLRRKFSLYTVDTYGNASSDKSSRSRSLKLE